MAFQPPSLTTGDRSHLLDTPTPSAGGSPLLLFGFLARLLLSPQSLSCFPLHACWVSSLLWFRGPPHPRSLCAGYFPRSSQKDLYGQKSYLRLTVLPTARGANATQALCEAPTCPTSIIPLPAPHSVLYPHRPLLLFLEHTRLVPTTGLSSRGSPLWALFPPNSYTEVITPVALNVFLWNVSLECFFEWFFGNRVAADVLSSVKMGSCWAPGWLSG